ncbi:hypothetical protein [uncultured Reyranella sp.]|uniref:hypothetical protein n=1 Tax=uncultured Reyranella sp. TaxID=735512 RepID=UPI00259CE7CF|nr:hypothetical protein [uncultured Reyranella sp.]
MMQKLFQAAAVVASGLMVASCDPIFENTAPRVANIQQVKSRVETRVTLTDGCIADSGPAATAAPLVAAAFAVLAPVAIEFITSAVEGYLKARVEALTGKHVAPPTGTAIYSGPAGNLQFRCITIARGAYVANPRDSVVGQQRRGSLDAEGLNRVRLGDFPDLFMEFGVTIEPGSESDKTASLILTPKMVQFAKTNAGRTHGDSKTINLLLMMSAAPIDTTKPDKDKATAVIPMQFEKVRIGTEIDAGLLVGRSVRIPIPKDPGPGRSAAPPGGRLPLNIVAYVEETETPTAFDQLLVSTYSGHKSDIGQGLLKLLRQALDIPEK